jgi:hypothetical protein
VSLMFRRCRVGKGAWYKCEIKQNLPLAACRTQVSIFVCADDGVTPHGD